MVEGACLENRCTATYRGFESLTHRIKASICWLFAFRSGFHPLIPRRSAAAPRGMPAALRFAGCLPVVALLLPPGTRLMALRPFGPQNCLAVTEGGAKERSDCANPSLTLHFRPSGLRTAKRQAGGGDRRGGLRREPNGAWGEEGLRPRPAPAVPTRRVAMDRSRTARMRAVGRNHFDSLRALAGRIISMIICKIAPCL